MALMAAEECDDGVNWRESSGSRSQARWNRGDGGGDGSVIAAAAATARLVRLDDRQLGTSSPSFVSDEMQVWEVVEECSGEAILHAALEAVDEGTDDAEDTEVGAEDVEEEDRVDVAEDREHWVVLEEEDAVETFLIKALSCRVHGYEDSHV
ncbi:hypothetical protein BGZ99_009136 [Dissophora globulifera]|uniref:Uncharacterized protein n=1 Tax=Dissophora globulifera TaxID=979702 RepID=A0A9P6R7P8_9FUNG|nr:hypothetical protein BGZ99_009136 [Dissophora globulifera]